MATTGTAGRGLSFLELIGLIDARAETTGDSHRQIARLIAASQAISSELDLQGALRNVVQVACDLVSAEFGAIGVISPEGTLEAFIHVGLADEHVERLGTPPTGHGILGAVITDQEPIRLSVLTDDVRSVGFPEHHPPMSDFLGVPIRVGGTIYGNLYLTGSSAGEFDDIDEQVMVTLASMAGNVIANSRLYEEAKLSNRWLVASEEVNQRLLSADFTEDDLRLIAEQILELAEASFATIIMPAGENVQAESAPPRFGRLAEDPAFHPDLDAATTLVLPWAASIGADAASLVIAREPNGRPFSTGETTMAARFAHSIAIARELLGARNDRERVALVDERDRIARDLHDHVIQSLFAVGLGLQSVVGSASGAVAARLASQVDAIDVTIRQIRQTIFQLGSPPSASSYSQKSRLNQLVRETLDGKGIDSSLDFAGPIDTLINSELSDEIAAVLREALSNVVRHASASRVDISVAVTSSTVRIVVTDNGRGLGDESRRSGLNNLEQRAALRGGTFAVAGRAPSGTTLDWSVPARATS